MKRALIATFALCAACGEPEAAPSEALPCAVEQIVAARCGSCHGEAPSFGAPMSLTRPEAFRSRASSVRAHVTSDVDRMPPPPNPPLAESERSTLLAWLEAGAPGGTACSESPKADGGVVTPLGCTPDLEIRPATPFEIPSGASDLTICYGAALSAGEKRHVIGFAPRVDSAAVLHHLSLLQTDQPIAETPGPCPDQGAMQSWRIVYGWAPGAESFELPENAGFAVEPGSSFVVQLHYVAPEGGTDASGFDLCTTAELRQHDADIMAFGTHEIFVPPHGESRSRCNVVVPSWGATVRLFATFPHMHRLGTSFRARVLPDIDLGTVPAWDFDRQSWLRIDHVLSPGDVIQTECAWKNPNAHGVGFGPSTEDEMCYGFTMYYPRIEDPSWHWMLPALSSECED